MAEDRASGQRADIGLPTPFAEAVLDLVELIPPGRVMTYGDVAAALGARGPRAVGTVMARFGSGVPWHRVIRAGGHPPTGHEREAVARYHQEGTAMVGGRVDLAVARWLPSAGDAVSASRRTDVP